MPESHNYMTWCTWQGLKNKLRCIFSSLKASASFSHCCRARTHRNLTRYPHRNLPERHQVSVFRNLTRYPHRNPPERHQVSAFRKSAPEPSKTSRGVFTRHLRRKLPEPHQISPQEPSGISPGICTRNFWNFSGTWHRNCAGSHRSHSGLKTS